MGDDQSSPPLARRVPGATRAAPGASERPVLSEDLLQRMQAVVSAAHAQAAEEQRLTDGDDTSPIPRLTASGAVATTTQTDADAGSERQCAAERERLRAAELERAAEEDRRRAAERERAAELERERAAERERQRAAEKEWQRRRPAVAVRTAADLLEYPGSRMRYAWRLRPAVLVAAATVVTAGALVVVLSSHGAKPRAAAGGRAAAPATLAAAWAAGQVSRNAVVGCDPAMCDTLRARGLDHLLILGSPGIDPLHSQVIMATAAVRKDLGARLGSVYAPDVLASFGGGAARVDIRMVAQDGVTAYRAAIATDLQNRRQAGSYLLSSSRVTASASARRQMLDGQVTSQLLIVITNLASLHPVDIVTFGNSGPGASADMPLRSAELAETGGAAAVQSMVAFLHQQKPPYLPALTQTVRLGGKPVLLVVFAAPTPLGLLGS